jgi:hypothetical protein
MTELVARLFILWLSGFLMGSGWINEEIRNQITNDPAIATAVQTALSFVAGLIWLGLWRLAKRFGWKT